VQVDEALVDPGGRQQQQHKWQEHQ
jgi:hypothetical protein